MYLLFAILLPLLVILVIINHFRKKKIIQKVNSLCAQEKCALLNELLEPFGYCYLSSQDLFSTRTDAWQRTVGYSSFYDKAASRLNMIFDYLPVYFDYEGRTWLLELWKGQYGINTGGEIGIYYADRILDEKERQTTLFTCVEDEDMLPMHMVLCRSTSPVANLEGWHWWLTAFRPGLFSGPDDLTLQASITFPTAEMAGAFVTGLFENDYTTTEIRRYCNTVSFSLLHTLSASGFLPGLRAKIAQKKNRFWCKIYLYITRPFQLSRDRVLYLYYYLPLAFRKTLRVRKTFRNSARK